VYLELEFQKETAAMANLGPKSRYAARLGLKKRVLKLGFGVQNLVSSDVIKKNEAAARLG
jgi:hypothetical protein